MTTILDIHDVPSYLQNTGLAIITILIPFAIAVLVDILQTKDLKNYYTLDLHVVLDRVFRLKYLIFFSAAMFLPPFFWTVVIWPIKIFILFSWFIGAYQLLRIIIDLYTWVKGDSYNFRYSYLESIEQKDGLVPAWRSVWDATNENSDIEQKFFNIFINKIESLLDVNKPIVVAHLIKDFSILSNKRSLFFMLGPDGAYKQILAWNHKVWLKKQGSNEWRDYRSIRFTLDEIIRNFYIRALKENYGYLLFEHLKEHVTMVENNDYRQTLLYNFFPIFFHEIENCPEKNDILKHYFPPEWKMTRSNMQNDSNIVCKMSLTEFLNWAAQRIAVPKNEYDFILDEVTRELFPETDPMIWATILTFLMTPYDPANRIESVIKAKWIFGHIGRTYVYWAGDPDEDYRKQRQADKESTYELALIVFGQYLSNDKLSEYISVLNSLTYDSKSAEEKRQQRLLLMFEELKVVASKINKKAK